MNQPKNPPGPLHTLLSYPWLARLLGRQGGLHGPSVSFWRMNTVFWFAFALINLAIRWSLNLPWSQAIILTFLNEGLAFFFALTLRRIYQRSEITFRLRTAVRVVVSSMISAFVLAVIGFSISNYTGWKTPNLTLLESAELHFILLWTALLGWSLGYFWIKAERAWVVQLHHAEEAEHDAYRMELQMLRAQLDPHFLFNSLNGIASEIQPRPETAVEMVCQLSDYLRYSLDHRKQTFSPLSAELSAMQSYLSIEQMRFGDKLKFTIDSTPQALASIVPSFLLQPLVENALKHNQAARRHGMELGIKVYREEGQLHIQVSNTGELIPRDPEAGGGLGLETLKRRLELHYPGRHHFQLEQQGSTVHAILVLGGKPCSA